MNPKYLTNSVNQRLMQLSQQHQESSQDRCLCLARSSKHDVLVCYWREQWWQEFQTTRLICVPDSPALSFPFSLSLSLSRVSFSFRSNLLFSAASSSQKMWTCQFTQYSTKQDYWITQITASKRKKRDTFHFKFCVSRLRNFQVFIQHICLPQSEVLISEILPMTASCAGPFPFVREEDIQSWASPFVSNSLSTNGHRDMYGLQHVWQVTTHLWQSKALKLTSD